jgi:hypothetical protein
MPLMGSVGPSRGRIVLPPSLDEPITGRELRSGQRVTPRVRLAVLPGTDLRPRSQRGVLLPKRVLPFTQLVAPFAEPAAPFA